GSHDLLDVIRIDSPLSSPTFTSQTVDFGDINNGSSFPSDAPQLGSSQTLDAGDGRLVNAVWRNNALWTANAVNPPSGPDAGQATAHWYKINTTNLGALSVADQGNVGGEGIAPGTYT